MNKFFKFFVLAVAIATAGCANVNLRSFANRCEGIGGAVRVGVLGSGQTIEHCVGENGQVLELMQPGQPTQRIMTSLDVVANPIGQKGLKETSMDCSVNEQGGRAGYWCNSKIHAESTEIFGKPVLRGGGGYSNAPAYPPPPQGGPYGR